MNEYNFTTYPARLFLQRYCSIFSGKAKSLPVCVFEASKCPTMQAQTERKKKTRCGPVKKEKKNQKKEPMPKEKPK